MKKLYFLDIVYEYDSDFYWQLNEAGYCYKYFKTRKEGVKAVKDFVKDIKTKYKQTLASEAKNGNTISVALYRGDVCNRFNIVKDDFYEASSDNYHVVFERYLCGRW